MLLCEDITDGLGMSYRVVSADRSINCDSAEYAVWRRGAIVSLIATAIGVPLIAPLAVKLVQHLFLNGSLRGAKTLFFFMTGGFQQKHYYWEAVTMARKAVISTIVVVVSDLNLRACMCVWVMLFFLGLQTSVLPYNQKRLSSLETSSILTILITFNLLMVQPMFPEQENPAVFWIINIVVFTINGLLFAVFALLISVSAKSYLKRLSETKPRLQFLKALFDDLDAGATESATESLALQVENIKKDMQRLHKRQDAMREAVEILSEVARRDNRLAMVLMRYRRQTRFAQLALTTTRAEETLFKLFQIEKLVVDALHKIVLSMRQGSFDGADLADSMSFGGDMEDNDVVLTL